jgi:Fe-S cluster assembly protein SufD
VLAGEGASCSLNGLYLTRDGELVDNCASVRHEAPRCSSWIGYKGVLDGKSSAVFSGQVHVARGAQKTDSNQLNNNLLLTDKATVNTKPLLAIYADDVKCTHGATVGPPPPEQVFYLRTRGVGEARAVAMLTEGFAGEIIGGVPVPELRDSLSRAVSARFRSR